MSQINDALRRARFVRAAAENAPPLMPPPLPRAEADDSSEDPIPITDDMLVPPLIAPEMSRRRSSRLPIILIGMFIFCVAGGVGFYLWNKVNHASKSFASDLEKKLALMEAAVAADTSNAPAKATFSESNGLSSIAAAAPKTSSVVTVAPPNPPPVVTAKPPVMSAAAASATPAKFPPLRLQSIFYRPNNPSVMINGKLLCISDEIQGVFVADIQPSSVTLVLSGYTNILTLR